MKTNNLVACPECDALQREVPLAPHGEAVCRRCGAELYRHKPASLDHTLALMLAAAVVFLCANAFPLMELDAQGIRTQTTLFGTVVALQDTGWPLIALLVLATTIVVPFLQLGLSLAVLVPLKLGRVPPFVRPITRAVDALWPWGMVEVFLLGCLVAFVKLRDVATVEPGLGLYAVAGYILAISSAVAAFEKREIWARVAEINAVPNGEARRT